MAPFGAKKALTCGLRALQRAKWMELAIAINPVPERALKLLGMRWLRWWEILQE